MRVQDITTEQDVRLSFAENCHDLYGREIMNRDFDEIIRHIEDFASESLELEHSTFRQVQSLNDPQRQHRSVCSRIDLRVAGVNDLPCQRASY